MLDILISAYLRNPIVHITMAVNFCWSTVEERRESGQGDILLQANQHVVICVSKYVPRSDTNNNN